MQVVLGYLQPFWRNSLLKCVSLPICTRPLTLGISLIRTVKVIVTQNATYTQCTTNEIFYNHYLARIIILSSNSQKNYFLLSRNPGIRTSPITGFKIGENSRDPGIASTSSVCVCRLSDEIKNYKKFELMLTRRAKAYSSSGSVA